MKTKTCPRCGVCKPYDHFPRNAATAEGIGTYCKPCHAERRKEWRLANPDKEREAKQEYARRNRAKHAANDKQLELPL